MDLVRWRLVWIGAMLLAFGAGGLWGPVFGTPLWALSGYALGQAHARDSR